MAQSLEDGGWSGSWDEFVEAWCSGTVPFGSWADHLVSWSAALQVGSDRLDLPTARLLRERRGPK